MLGPREARGRRTRKGASAKDGKHQPEPGPLPFHTHSFRGFEAARSRFTRARLEGWPWPLSRPPFSFVSPRGLGFLPPFKARGFSPLEATFFSFLESAQGGTPVFLFQFLLSRRVSWEGQGGDGAVGSRAASGSTRRGSWCLRGPGPSVSRP